VKLAATATALVAALSLFAGCATDNDGEGGQFAAGLRPAKPSADDVIKNPFPNVKDGAQQVIVTTIPDDGFDDTDSLNNSNLVAETIQSPIRFANVNIGDALDVLIDHRNPTELHVVDGGGHLICRIWVDKGHLQMSDCGR